MVCQGARVAKVSVLEANTWHDMTLDEFRARLAKARKWWGNQRSAWWAKATTGQIAKASELYWALEDVQYIMEQWQFAGFD